MQLHEALRDAPAFLRNAQDTAQRSPVNPDTLYMWDNQVTAIEQFLASTEDFSKESTDLAQARKELFELKRTIQNKVLEFELKQENQEMPPEPSEDDMLSDLAEYGKDIGQLCRELAKAQVSTVKQVDELEDARQQLNNFLVDSEPFLGKNKELDAVRIVAKKTRADLETRIEGVLKEWRAQDLAGGDEEESEG